MWCLYVFLGYYYYLFILFFGNMFYCTDHKQWCLLIMNRGKRIYKLALFVYLFFPMYKTSNL